MDPTLGPAVFETTKPATTNATKSTSAGHVDFFHGVCIEIEEAFSLWERSLTVWCSIHMLKNLFIFSISFSLVVIDFAELEVTPTRDVSFIFVALPHRSTLWTIPLFLKLRRYHVFSWLFKNVYLQLLFSIEAFLCHALSGIFEARCLDILGMLNNCFYIGKFTSTKEQQNTVFQDNMQWAKVAGRCLRCVYVCFFVYSYMARLSWLQFNVFMGYFCWVGRA